MSLEAEVNSVDPHHAMLAGTGAAIGYMSYLLWPAYLVSPYLAIGSGALAFYIAARSV